ncbi:glutamate--cysteine ligase regulatory subunit, partial [Lecanoromycetidae sp. Uapishka_2]
MNGGPSIIRRPTSEKSNVELINALRSNFLVSRQAFAPTVNGSSGSSSPTPATNGSSPNVPYSKWTARENGSLFIPSINFSQSGLAEERSQYDITVKLFFLPHTSASERCEHTQEAMDLVLRELHMPSIDLLIVSFPGVSFDADDEDEEEEPHWSQNGEGEDLNAMADTWKALEMLRQKNIALQIGVSEFGSERLQKFLPRTKVRPSVDQINVRDCCVVPKSLILYAKQERIELLTHNDCTNVLPSGTVRELLCTGESGAGILAGPEENSDGLKGEVEPKWVVKYTAVVRDRGVIENKGYFAMAEVRD